MKRLDSRDSHDSPICFIWHDTLTHFIYCNESDNKNLYLSMPTYHAYNDGHEALRHM